jgi:hypothetical protein
MSTDHSPSTHSFAGLVDAAGFDWETSSWQCVKPTLERASSTRSVVDFHIVCKLQTARLVRKWDTWTPAACCAVTCGHPLSGEVGKPVPAHHGSTKQISRPKYMHPWTMSMTTKTTSLQHRKQSYTANSDRAGDAQCGWCPQARITYQL